MVKLVVFWVYAVTLLMTAHWISHQVFEGWLARLVTMGGIALGLLPWVTWLRPRLVRLMGFVGRGMLVVCYFTVLAPFAVLARFLSDPLRMRRPRGTSQWRPRVPLPNTIEAARREY